MRSNRPVTRVVPSAHHGTHVLSLPHHLCSIKSAAYSALHVNHISPVPGQPESRRTNAAAASRSRRHTLAGCGSRRFRRTLLQAITARPVRRLITGSWRIWLNIGNSCKGTSRGVKR